MNDILSWSELFSNSKLVECKVKELVEKYRSFAKECVPSVYKEDGNLIFNFCGNCYPFPLSDFKNDCFEILPGDHISLKSIAGQDLQAGDLVYIENSKAYKFDKNNLNLINRSVGLTAYSSLIDTQVEIITTGNVCNQFGALSVGQRYFADVNGQITNIPPIENIKQIIGIAVSTTEILVNIQESLIKII